MQPLCQQQKDRGCPGVTGAALAFHLVEASGRILNEMATFDSAGVTDKTDLVEGSASSAPDGVQGGGR